MSPSKEKTSKPKKASKPSTDTGAAGQIDLLVAGPMLFVPEVQSGIVTALEVFAPPNGHPVGAVFLPGIWFSEAELNDPQCERWPAPESFVLLDPHSYAIEFTQSAGKKKAASFPVSAIPATNHKVRPGRRIGSGWEISIAIKGQLSAWSSHRLMTVPEGFYHGADRPVSGASVSSLQRLTYVGVTAADLCGASEEARQYLHEHSPKGGSLIVIGEIPYQSSLLHERQAINALAKLAGLDIHLASTTPAAFRTQLMEHITYCGLSTIVAE